MSNLHYTQKYKFLEAQVHFSHQSQKKIEKRLIPLVGSWNGHSVENIILVWRLLDAVRWIRWFLSAFQNRPGGRFKVTDKQRDAQIDLLKQDSRQLTETLSSKNGTSSLQLHWIDEQ